jgi:hypothetical protein
MTATLKEALNLLLSCAELKVVLIYKFSQLLNDLLRTGGRNEVLHYSFIVIFLRLWT